MPNQSKLALYRTLIPAKYLDRIKLELQRTILAALSLLQTHRRKALLLSLGPATILKFITVILPIIKLLPPTIKAIKTLSYFTSNKNGSDHSSGRGNSNGVNAHANKDANAAAAADGLGLTMDELSEILWTPAEDTYWERVNAMVSRHGLYKTLGVTLAGVRPGRVEIIMPFSPEVSGEGGSFHASLLPTLIAMTSQLTGTTLLPQHFTLKPIDFKCNILSDCDPSTYLLVSRGAVVVRGDHSITVKVEIMKASGLVPGSSEIISSPNRPALSSWKSWLSSSPTGASSPSLNSPSVLVPGTSIERNKFVMCASGMQTCVVVRAGTDQNNEEETAIQRLKREREQRLKQTSSTSASYSEAADESIVFGDTFRPASAFGLAPLRAASSSSSRSMSPDASAKEQQQYYPQHQTSLAQSLDSSTFEVVSTSSSFVEEPRHIPAATLVTTTTVLPISYASAARHAIEQHHSQHDYEETSDTEAWQS
ncbi:hypothetical protein BGZ98_003604 [Dissophora globulifera]|nr:hypothetical protein BGZ98_003604 [Dissophora globulifera]